MNSTFVSPLRDGAKRGVVVGAEDQSVPPTLLPALSEPISVSTMLPIPPESASASPPWLAAEVTKQIKAATISLQGKVSGDIVEVERVLAENGDYHSWWAVAVVPRKR